METESIFEYLSNNPIVVDLKVPKDPPLKVRIYDVVSSTPEGFTLSEISTSLNETRQSIKYNLTCMQHDGQIIKRNDLYFIQPIIQSNEIEEAFFAILTKHLEKDGIILDDCVKVDEVDAIFNSIHLQFQTLIYSVKKILTDS